MPLVVTFSMLLTQGKFSATSVAFKKKENTVEAVSPVIVFHVLVTVVFKALFRNILYPLPLILPVLNVKLKVNLDF